MNFVEMPFLKLGKWEKEPIEWQILNVDEYGNALLISRFVLTYRLFDTRVGRTSWAECSLRKWLNEEFFNFAFKKGERKLLRDYEAEAYNHPKFPVQSGEDCYDKVSVLSTWEVMQYLPRNIDRICYSSAKADRELKKIIEMGDEDLQKYLPIEGQKDNLSLREYAEDCLNYVNSERSSTWWLRTPGSGLAFAMNVYSDGTISDTGRCVRKSFEGVRPVIMLSCTDMFKLIKKQRHKDITEVMGEDWEEKMGIGLKDENN